MPRLIANWWKVLHGSWSSRLAFALSALSIAQGVLSTFEAAMKPATFAAVSALLGALIMVARVIQQNSLHEDELLVLRTDGTMTAKSISVGLHG